MKKILVGLLISVMFFSCQDKNSYTITATVNGAEEGLKVFLYADPEEGTIIDSTDVKNGAFSLTGAAQDIPRMSFLAIRDKDGLPAFGKSQLIVLEPGLITVVAGEENPSVSGTPLNDMNKDFEAKMSGFDRAGQFGYMQSFIKENAGNALGAFYFSIAFPIFEPNEIKEILTSIPTELKSSERMVEVQNQITLMEEQSIIGKKFTDVKGLTIAGKESNLSDFVGKGKVVLVDFWASWCGPCIVELPNVIKAYEKYKDKGFEIVGVSLDTDKKAWESATKKHSIAWPQFSNLKGWEDPAARAYGVSGIPYTILIDKDGTIIAERLRGEQISAKLDELLNK